jgi:hypothetical protein
VLAEKLAGRGTKCQGTTLVVPQRQQNERGFSPCGMLFGIKLTFFSKLFSRADSVANKDEGALVSA